MGVVRFLLAIIVVLAHAGFPMESIRALGSVQAFFVLSGVYMAAVWTTKYGVLERGARYFYLNRIMRLWPTYLFLLLLTFAAYKLFGAQLSGDDELFNLFEALDAQGVNGTPGIMLFLSVTLFGQDIASVNESVHYLLTQHDWRWSYFLPFGNFGYFLLGCALYFLTSHARIDALKAKLKHPRRYAMILMIGILFFWGEASFERANIIHHLGFMALFSLATLLLFERAVKGYDITLGNIAYGIYLNHFVILVVAKGMGLPTAWVALITVAGAVLLSLLTEKFIQKPIDRYRHGLTKLQSGAGAATPPASEQNP